MLSQNWQQYTKTHEPISHNVTALSVVVAVVVAAVVVDGDGDGDGVQCLLQQQTHCGDCCCCCRWWWYQTTNMTNNMINTSTIPPTRSISPLLLVKCCKYCISCSCPSCTRSCASVNWSSILCNTSQHNTTLIHSFIRYDNNNHFNNNNCVCGTNPPFKWVLLIVYECCQSIENAPQFSDSALNFSHCSCTRLIIILWQSQQQQQQQQQQPHQQWSNHDGIINNNNNNNNIKQWHLHIHTARINNTNNNNNTLLSK